jgi:hypothetical protein
MDPPWKVNEDLIYPVLTLREIFKFIRNFEKLRYHLQFLKKLYQFISVFGNLPILGDFDNVPDNPQKSGLV